MLTLNENGLRDRAAWLEKGYALPGYDRAAMIAATRVSPRWIHFGAGNIFRAFQCNAVQRLLETGAMDTGIVAVEGYDYEIIEKGYRPNDNYTLLVTLKADGSVEKTVIGSIAESCILDSGNAAEYSRLKAIFAHPGLQMASFTITEKGYAVTPAVEADFANGPEAPQSYIGKVASLLYARYRAGGAPIAMVSMDNCSHNGDKLKAAILAFAKGWNDAGFTAYVTGGQDEDRMADFFLQKGAANVVIKLGSKGSYFKNQEKCFYTDPFEVTPVDTTGCGDNFTAGFIHAFLKGLSMEECVRFASAAGALNSLGLGASSYIRSEQMVLDFMQNNGQKRIIR